MTGTRRVEVLRRRTRRPSTAQPPHFRVSPQILEPLGLEQLQDPGLAILELVKNSWDADAHEVTVQVVGAGVPRCVRVMDDGSGMSTLDFENHWLVLGDTHKRRKPVTDDGRPVIGEKGLGRLACFALGTRVVITSHRDNSSAFRVAIDWTKVVRAPSLDVFPIALCPAQRSRGTTVDITGLRRAWTDQHAEFLSRHIEFLAIPAKTDRFIVHLEINGERRSIPTRPDVLDQYAEAELTIRVEEGVPRITSARVASASYEGVAFRRFLDRLKDARLDGTIIRLLFFRRASGARGEDLLATEHIKDLLERYEGVRIFRDGLNIPPYGLSGMDWPKLEKQRTATGGPTMVPGNSQLIGEVHLSRQRHRHLTVTAGRAGFTDQEAVSRLAEYVRWAARCVGTIRRAAQLGITRGAVPPRVDDRGPVAAERPAADRFRQLVTAAAARPEAKSVGVVKDLVEVGEEFLKQYQVELRTSRIYAQLATTGASAASFAHELRKDFDAVDDVVKELGQHRRRLAVLAQPLDLLRDAWQAIRGFVGLFKLVPIKIRREPQDIAEADLKASLRKLVDGIPHSGIQVDTHVSVPNGLRMAPAELDSIVLNLYTNAVKAIRESPNRNIGRVLIRLEAHESALSVSVLDNGCGVTPEVAKVMWNPIEGAFSEGTGMGLPITKFLVGLHGGALAHTDRPEPGYTTAFQVHLRDVLRA